LDQEYILYINVDISNLFHYSTFSDLAVAVVNECSIQNEQYTLSLLSRKVGNWGDMSCLELAVGTGNKYFISHRASQTLLKTIWMGKLSFENSTAKVSNVQCKYFNK